MDSISLYISKNVNFFYLEYIEDVRRCNNSDGIEPVNEGSQFFWQCIRSSFSPHQPAHPFFFASHFSMIRAKDPDHSGEVSVLIISIWHTAFHFFHLDMDPEIWNRILAGYIFIKIWVWIQNIYFLILKRWLHVIAVFCLKPIFFVFTLLKNVCNGDEFSLIFH